MHALLQPLNHTETAACVEAERAMSRALAGSCTVPLGAYASMRGNQLHMTGFVASVDGGEMVRAEVSGSPGDADALGKALAQKLVAQGADRILAALENHA
jgi:hydroxymethylbilane synthase